MIEAGPVVTTLLIDGEGRQPEVKPAAIPGISPDGAWVARIARDHIVAKKTADESERALPAPIEAEASYRGGHSSSPYATASPVSGGCEGPDPDRPHGDSPPPA